jgi:small GTP-binding protein
LINALTGQEIAIVSDVAGTTTDPVKKSIEIEGIGPVIMIDTAGVDDTGELGQKRVSKTREVLKIIDMAILVIAENLFGKPEDSLIKDFQNQDIPFIIKLIYNRLLKY